MGEKLQASVLALVTAVGGLGVLAAGSAPAAAAPPMTCGGKPVTIFTATDGNDDLLGTTGADVVHLGAGHDRFQGLDGDDLVCGGSGNDKLFGGEGNDHLSGQDGRDRLGGGGGNDRLFGGNHADTLVGGDGDDSSKGGNGNDYVSETAGGNDKIAGDAGRDYLSYRRITDGSVRVVLSRGEVTGAAGFDKVGIETVEGTPQGDAMYGSAESDDLRGGGGADKIRGGAGNDVLYASGGVVDGGSGNDFIDARGSAVARGGDGADSIRIRSGSVRAYGGAAADAFSVVSYGATPYVDGDGALNQLSFASFRRGLSVNVGEGRARWSGGSMRFTSIAIVRGSKRADTLVGSSRGDYLDGLRGDDVLRGGGGGDLLVGRTGFDRAIGGSGYDVCRAESRFGCERR